MTNVFLCYQTHLLAGASFFVSYIVCIHCMLYRSTWKIGRNWWNIAAIVRIICHSCRMSAIFWNEKLVFNCAQLLAIYHRGKIPSLNSFHLSSLNWPLFYFFFLKRFFVWPGISCISLYSVHQTLVGSFLYTRARLLPWIARSHATAGQS